MYEDMQGRRFYQILGKISGYEAGEENLPITRTERSTSSPSFLTFLCVLPGRAERKTGC